MSQQLEFGLDTFGDVTERPNGGLLPQAQVIRNVVDEAVLADTLGIDFIGLGEHHRPDFAISAPDVILAAIAARTKNIHLGTSVTILSTDDPVRVFERFSTLDAISGGRAEVTMGRGSFIESFSLFGYDLDHYEELFSEKLDLFAAMLQNEAVTWNGKTRSALKNQIVYPRPENRPLKTWIGVGGTPQSVVRAAYYGLPLIVAIIGGDPARFVPLMELFRRSLHEGGKAPLPVGVHSPGHIAESDEKAREELWPGYKIMRDRIGAERGWPPLSKDEFLREAEHGSLYVGSPETVARKIAAAMKVLGASRFQFKYSSGPMEHAKLMRSIELYAIKVIPLVRDMLA